MSLIDGMPPKRDPRVSCGKFRTYFLSVVAGTVVDDEDLDVDIRLRQHAPHTARQVTGVVVGGNDDADRAQASPSGKRVACRATSCTRSKGRGSRPSSVDRSR